MLSNGAATIIHLSASESDTTPIPFESATSIPPPSTSTAAETTANATNSKPLSETLEPGLVLDKRSRVRAVRITGATTSITTDEDTEQLGYELLSKSKSCIEFRQSSKVYNYYQIAGRSASVMGFLNFNSECLEGAIAVTNFNFNSMHAANPELNTSSSSYFNLFMKAGSSMTFPRLLWPTSSLKTNTLTSTAEAGGAVDAIADRRKACFRRILASQWCTWAVWPLLILCALIIVAYFTKDYAYRLIMWTEKQNQWIVLSIITVLFLVVSFPIAVGYFLLKLTTGYIYGFLQGFSITIIATAMGITLTHIVLRSMQRRFNFHKYIKNKKAIAILRVLNGTKSFRIVVFSRMTPLPFGIQNLIFSLSTMKLWRYLLASFIGMLPSQLLAIYLGSGLRSMQEVLSNKKMVLPTYILIGVGVILGLLLMTWIIVKARIELAKMLAEQNAAVA